MTLWLLCHELSAAWSATGFVISRAYFALITFPDTRNPKPPETLSLQKP